VTAREAAAIVPSATNDRHRRLSAVGHDGSIRIHAAISTPFMVQSSHGAASPIAAPPPDPMDDSFRQQVERARRMTPDQRFREGLALCDRAFRLMTDGIRHQFPDATPEEVLRILRQRLDIIRALETKR